jgi:hypothetical protein
MKTITKSLIIAIVLLAAPSFAAISSRVDSVHVLSVKRYIFHFKVDKSLIGAKVEVFNHKNDMVLTETVAHAKTIVDFFELPAGNYTIKITKGTTEYTYEYINRE